MTSNDVGRNISGFDGTSENIPTIATTTTAAATTASITISSGGNNSRQQQQRRRNSSSQHHRLCCLRGGCAFINNFLRLRVSPEELEQRYKSREIDKYLAKDKHTLSRQVKLLLLGAGESGKSTFLKQMRIIHKINFEPELLIEYQFVIYQNIIKGMQVLIDACEKLDIQWDNTKTQLAANEAKKFYSNIINGLDIEKFQQYSPTIKLLWQDNGIRKAFERRYEFQISDSVSYFFDELDRISNINYIPSHKDILYCRKATKGVYEFKIRIENIPFVFVDVGGQRTQRQKWTKCFDNSVTSIIFLVSSSEFDQVLAEDRKTNRLEESKNIFDTIVNNQSFKGISIILFLNKIDLLAEKVKNPNTDIRWYYPQFKRNPHSLDDVKQFILDMFKDVCKNNNNNLNNNNRTTSAIYSHFTTAIDTQNIQFVFNSVKKIILQKNLSEVFLR